MKKITLFKAILFVISFFIFFLSCKNSGSGNHSTKGNISQGDSSLNPTHGKVNYNIFIENSGSMDGYLTKQSMFKDDLIKFISDIPAYFNINPSLYFINNKACKIPENSTQSWAYFIQNLNPQNSKLQCPPKDSEIDKVIDIATTQIGDDVNIVISDCIFSKLNVNPAVAEADLKIFFSKKLATQDVSTIVLKFRSEFTGPYYVESNLSKPLPVHDINRPYYILLFGKENNLKTLIEKLKLKDYKGFENSYCLLSGTNKKEIKAAITSYSKEGTFSFEKPATRLVINDAKPNRENIFQFSINVNLSTLGIEESFLVNPKNYACNSNFKIVSIEKINPPAEYTHIFIVATDDLKQRDSLSIGLKYDIPQWVKETGIDIDNNPNDPTQQTQTYGFAHLMLGISSAYSAKFGESQFLLPAIKISRDNYNTYGKNSSFPWWIIIAAVLSVGILIWLKNKK